jgi:alpha-mannosidase
MVQVVSDSVIVRDSEGNEIKSQLLLVTNAALSLREEYVKAYLGNYPRATPMYWLALQVSVPPLGFSTYIVSPSKKIGQNISTLLHGISIASKTA